MFGLDRQRAPTPSVFAQSPEREVGQGGSGQPGMRAVAAGKKRNILRYGTSQ